MLIYLLYIGDFIPIKKPLTYKKTVKGKEITKLSKSSTHKEVKKARQNITSEQVSSILTESKLIGKQVVRLLLSKGLDARQLKLRGILSHILKEKLNLSVKDLESIGYNINDILFAGYAPIQLKSSGYGVKKLKYLGFDARKVMSYGYSLSNLRSLGFNVKDLISVGYSPKELLSAGLSVRDLISSGVSQAEVIRIIAELKKK